MTADTEPQDLQAGQRLDPRFAGRPRWFQIVGAHLVVDQTYGPVEANLWG